MAIIGETNVTMSAIRDALNSAGGSVGNSLGSFFSSSAKLNKWSKYKPVICYKQPFLNDDRRWMGDNNLCGFTAESVLFKDTDSLVGAYESGNTFVYDIPAGTEEEPMRTGDFRGYNTGAKNPIWSFDYEGQMAANQPSSSSTFKILGNGDIDDKHNLKMSDLSPTGTSISEWYFGVMFTDTSGNVVLTGQSASAIGSAKNFTSSVTVTASQFNPAKYMAYPCFIGPGTPKSYMACPIGGISFEVVASIDAERLGWMSGTGWYSVGSKFTYQGQLAWVSYSDGTNVYIALQVNGVDVSGEEVSLKADSQSADGKTKYMTYTRSIQRAEQANETFQLRVAYGSGWANNAYLNLTKV